MASQEAWVGIAEVAAHIRVTRDSIYRWVEAKDFPAHRVGRLLRFRLSVVAESLKNSGRSDAEAPQRAKQRQRDQEKA